MSSNPRDLSGTVSFVTGGASGLGAATAALLRECGSTVVVGDIHPGEGDRHLNVADEAAVDALVADIVSEHGRLDYAANFAGIVFPGQLVDLETSVYREQMDVLLDGMFYCNRAELRAMVLNRSGSIVNISSTAGLSGSANVSVYSAAKHGVVGLTRSAALEYAPIGIRVNAICPGTIWTPMTAGMFEQVPGMAERASEATPLGRLGDPSEIAEAALFLLSMASSFITGVALRVDGGVAGRG